VAAAEIPAGGVIATTLYAVGGAEQLGPRLVADSGLTLPAPRHYAARLERYGSLGLVSGFFAGPWAAGAALLPTGRSQFAALGGLRGAGRRKHHRGPA